MYCLAVDIGASGGRHILGTVKDGKITTEEIYRFQNGVALKSGLLCWDTERLFREIKNGMKKCAESGKKPESMSVDCFGVDFVLLDKDGNRLGDAVSYRDKRTEGIRESFPIAEETLYRRTGMKGGNISSVYQLMYLKDTENVLSRADRFLQLPDYFNYLLTGVKKNEFTISSTALLVNTETADFDREILERLGLPTHIFGKPAYPATVLGRLKPEITLETGLDCDVVLCASHDTVSAETAVPCGEDCIFLNSGTWSMIGTYIEKPILTTESMDAGFSSLYICPGHYGYTKGITGLWMIQSIKRELGDKYGFGALCEMAEKSAYKEIIDVDDCAFAAPDSMLGTVKNYTLVHQMLWPESLGDVLNCIYHSLAFKYAEAVRQIEKITGKQYGKIYIIGGGSKDMYLNHLTAEYTGKEVYAGLAEATANGNIAAQLTAKGVFSSLWEAKKAVLPPVCVS